MTHLSLSDLLAEFKRTQHHGEAEISIYQNGDESNEGHQYRFGVHSSYLWHYTIMFKFIAQDDSIDLFSYGGDYRSPNKDELDTIIEVLTASQL